MVMRTESTERLGLVEEGRRRRARYGRYIYRAPALPADKPPPVDLATAEIRSRIDKRREELIAAQIETEAQHEADLELAKVRAIRDRQPRLDDLLRLVAEVTNVSVQSLKGQRRARAIAWPRQFAMWLMCECRRDVSFPMIGRALGGRDHTTVGHGLRCVRAKQDHPTFKAWMDDQRIRDVLSRTEVEP
jgi:chromosomal replication initiator protein